MENNIDEFLSEQKRKLEADKNRLNMQSVEVDLPKSGIATIEDVNECCVQGKGEGNDSEPIRNSASRNSSGKRAAVPTNSKPKSPERKSEEEVDPNLSCAPDSEENFNGTIEGVDETVRGQSLANPFEIYDQLTRGSASTAIVTSPELQSQPEDNRVPSYIAEHQRRRATATLSKAEKNINNRTKTFSLDKIDFDNTSSVLSGAAITAGEGSGAATTDHHPYYMTQQQDDMEQWVSDAFYLYFPSFNQYNKKREQLARDRHLEYQTYLKQVANTEIKKKNVRSRHYDTTDDEQKSKPEKEVEAELKTLIRKERANSEHSTRPGSAKYKLLEDLKHADHILHSDAIDERNRLWAENEAKRKLEYQKELIRQIEEKRREVQIIKEKEKKEEELLTKKLEEQLKTMKLEAELEKEMLKTEKIRIASEQNKILREHLLSKLEKDKERFTPYQQRLTQSENGKDIMISKDNRVYKYFSNSARNQKMKKYDRNSLLDENDSDVSTVPLKDSMNESSKCDSEHPNGTLCTFCNSGLKILDNCCSKCKEKIASDDDHSYRKCENCNDRYLICGACDKHFIPCITCQQKRNICNDCMENLCICCNRPIKQCSPTTSSRLSEVSSTNNDAHRKTNLKSFKLLENPRDASYEINNLKSETSRFLAKKGHTTKLPYSMNYDSNSIFNPNNKLMEPNYAVMIKNGEVSLNKVDVEEKPNVDNVKRKTNDRLTRYAKNYGDLRSRKTKKKNTVLGKDNVEKNFTTAPLFREHTSKIPISRAINQNTELPSDNYMKLLSNKWDEIPVGPKETMTQACPTTVFTQVGAIRKQLQQERFKDQMEKL